MGSDTPAREISKVIQVDEAKLRGQLGELVRGRRPGQVGHVDALAVGVRRRLVGGGLVSHPVATVGEAAGLAASRRVSPLHL